MAKVGSGGVGTTLVLAILLVAVSLAAGAGFTYLIWNPTQPTESSVVLGVQRLNELATVRQTIQVIVTEEENESILTQPLPEFLTGEKLLLVAVGEVEAGVDLNELEQDDVRVVGKTVTIDLPNARILGSSLDEAQTRLYDRNRGLLKLRGNDELLEQARRNGEDKMVETAKEGGIVEQAQQNAEDTISTFVTSLGYQKVVFT